MSAESRFDFLIIGVTTAAFKQSGIVQVAMEVFISCVRNGARRATHCFRSHVGSGSALECLLGAFMMSSVTDSSDTDLKLIRKLGGAAANSGGGALAVRARMLATLSAKNLVNSSAV
jgi:hypothetical protein